LRWADVDFEAGTITIRDGKAKREDIIPMHRQLADELAHRLEERPALPQAKVFPTVVTDVTRRKDFLRAGIARREVVTGAKAAKPLTDARLYDTMRHGGTACDNAAGVAQWLERQPSKLAVEGSSPFARFAAGRCVRSHRSAFFCTFGEL